MAPNIDPQGYQITLPPTDGPHPFWEEPSPPPAGQGIPAGGTTGQVLKKHSNEDYDVEWADESGGGGSGGDLPTGGQDGDLLTKDNSVSGGAVWKTPDFADAKDVEEIAGEVAHASADIILLKKDMAQVKEEDISQNAAIASQSERVGTLEGDMAAVKEKNNEQDTALESQGAAIAAQQTELSNVKTTVGDLNTKVTTLGADVEQVKTEQATLEGQVSDLDTKVNNIRQVPDGGNAGEVVQKTADGYGWGVVSGGLPPMYAEQNGYLLNISTISGAPKAAWRPPSFTPAASISQQSLQHTFTPDDPTFTRKNDVVKTCDNYALHIEDGDDFYVVDLNPCFYLGWSVGRKLIKIADVKLSDGCVLSVSLTTSTDIGTSEIPNNSGYPMSFTMTFAEGVTSKVLTMEFLRTNFRMN